MIVMVVVMMVAMMMVVMMDKIEDEKKTPWRLQHLKERKHLQKSLL